MKVRLKKAAEYIMSSAYYLGTLLCVFMYFVGFMFIIGLVGVLEYFKPKTTDVIAK